MSIKKPSQGGLEDEIGDRDHDLRFESLRWLHGPAEGFEHGRDDPPTFADSVVALNHEDGLYDRSVSDHLIEDAPIDTDCGYFESDLDGIPEDVTVTVGAFWRRDLLLLDLRKERAAVSRRIECPLGDIDSPGQNSFVGRDFIESRNPRCAVGYEHFVRMSEHPR